MYILGRFFQTSKYFYQKGYSRALKGSYINVKSEGTAKSAQGTQGFGLPKKPTLAYNKLMQYFQDK